MHRKNLKRNVAIQIAVSAISSGEEPPKSYLRDVDYLVDYYYQLLQNSGSEVIEEATIQGDLELIDHLIKYYNIERIESIFADLAKYGYLDVLKWLWQIAPDIDIRAEDEDDHLDVL